MKRRIAVFGAGVAALIMAASAVAWACTTTHFGYTHFCVGDNYCSYLFRYTGTLDNDSSYSQAIQDGRANSTYTLTYITGSGIGNTCMNSSSNFGTLSTNSGGDGHKLISLTGVSTGNYTACPQLHPTSTSDEGTDHIDFTIVD